jgi:ABC-type multidrug transport system ATPase subunit
VPEVKRGCCSCADNPVQNYMQDHLGVSNLDRDAFYALDRVSGCIKSGQMCLVLGANEQSKSTLLRALCSRLNEQDDLSGSILVDGYALGSKGSQGWRRLSPYVSASDASHSAVLTVKETLAFATQCTSDGHRSQEDIDRRVDRLLDMLDLSHVADTVVGDENLRGISGGQKRRVTVGEMMTDPKSAFFCFENITDGLASTDSLQLIQNLSSICRGLNKAAFISLLQPSDDIVEFFDKILVLTSSGEMAYFGGIDRPTLRTIFLGTNNANSAEAEEDTGSFADLVLSQSLRTSTAADGGNSKEDQVVKRFVASQTYDDLVRELAEIRAKAPPAGNATSRRCCHRKSIPPADGTR